MKTNTNMASVLTKGETANKPDTSLALEDFFICFDEIVDLLEQLAHNAKNPSAMIDRRLGLGHLPKISLPIESLIMASKDMLNHLDTILESTGASRPLIEFLLEMQVVKIYGIEANFKEWLEKESNENK